MTLPDPELQQLAIRLTELPTEDQAERLIRELALQLDRINDHLNGIERALSFMADNAPVTEFRRDHGRDRP